MGNEVTPPPTPRGNGSNMKFPEVLRGKRLLLATESFGPVNGVSRTTGMLVQYLRDNAVNVAIVAPEISTGSSETITTTSTTTDTSQEIEVRLKGYPLPYNPELSVVYPVRLSQLYARTFNAPPDLIYLASPASLGFQVLLQLRQQQKSQRVPVLLNFQTDLSGYCEILFPRPLDAWAVWVFRSVQGYLFRHPTVRTVFYPSGFVRRYLENAGVPSNKMLNLRRGVNCEVFNPSKKSDKLRKRIAPNGELLLISVSRIAAEKGFEFLAAATKKLEESGFPFKLLVVGGNKNPDVISDVQNLFSSLPAGHVEFAGQLRGEELATAYASADVFLHCSVTETFGLVVLESMASGVPVIARDEGGPSEIVTDKESGYLVPPSDLSTFVEKIIYLGNNTQLRKRMALESRRLAEEATWEKINNLVACKLAEALETRETLPEATPNFAVPLYSWLLLSKALRDFLRLLIVDARLLAGLGAIFGVWVGLVITWGLVQVGLVVKRVVRGLGVCN